jgi:hypothetical protein
MKRRYSSFLIRCWLLDSGEQRIKIEHIQSGEAVQVASPTAAITWVRAHWSELFGREANDQFHPESESRQNTLPENL